jgi:hypothetical protein
MYRVIETTSLRSHYSESATAAALWVLLTVFGYAFDPVFTQPPPISDDDGLVAMSASKQLA